MRRAVLLLLLLLAIPLAGCGDDDGDAETTSSAPPSAETRVEGGAEATAPGEDGRAPAAGDSPAGEGGGGGDSAVPGGIDLTVDPSSIGGARVTATGAVQTLPPNEKAQETAQENGYSSINSFGEEATGEEATNITFALVQYLTAKAEGDWATACARLYGVLRENLERGPDDSRSRSCPEAYGELMSRVPQATLAEQARIDVSSVRRGDGNRAFVVYKTPDTLSADMPMYVEEGVWKVGALEAYALTPGQAG